MRVLLDLDLGTYNREEKPTLLFQLFSLSLLSHGQKPWANFQGNVLNINKMISRTYQLFWSWRQNILALSVNTMSADALALQSHQSISRHGIGWVRQTMCIVVPDLI